MVPHSRQRIIHPLRVPGRPSAGGLATAAKYAVRRASRGRRLGVITRRRPAGRVRRVGLGRLPAAGLDDLDPMLDVGGLRGSDDRLDPGRVDALGVVDVDPDDDGSDDDGGSDGNEDGDDGDDDGSGNDGSGAGDGSSEATP